MRIQRFDELAEVEGGLGVEGPEAVEALAWADGPDASLRYRLV